MSGEKTFRWDYRQQPPIAEHVCTLTGHTVHLTMQDTGSDEYELLVSRIGDTPDATERKFAIALPALRDIQAGSDPHRATRALALIAAEDL